MATSNSMMSSTPPGNTSGPLWELTISSGVDNFVFSSPPSYYRVMRPRSNSKNFTGVVREILGTAQSVGCTIDHETPQVGICDSTRVATKFLRRFLEISVND